MLKSSPAGIMHLYFDMHGKETGKSKPTTTATVRKVVEWEIFSKIYISFFEERRLFQTLTEHNLVLAVSSLSGRLRIRYESWIARLFLKYRQWLAEIAAKTSTVVCDWSLRAVNNTSHDSLNIHEWMSVTHPDTWYVIDTCQSQTTHLWSPTSTVTSCDWWIEWWRTLVVIYSMFAVCSSVVLQQMEIRPRILNIRDPENLGTSRFLDLLYLVLRLVFCLYRYTIGKVICTLLNGLHFETRDEAS